MTRFKKMLVANRGEIAVRIIMALKELGIQSVAIHSMQDSNAIYTKIADEKVCIGESNSMESYLNTYKILSAATTFGVDSIHPGIGFLAENEDFPDLCKEYGIDFIGPDSKIIKMMGNKWMAKMMAKECGIPVIEGSDGPISSLDECSEVISKVGLPVVLKATYGGGGKGIRTILKEEEIETYYNICLKEAEAAFYNSELIIEQFLQNTRHIEVQILGDRYGHVIHLGERECTIQRSNQKLIEEARSANIDEELRQRLYKDAVKLARHIGYIGPGTVEFLVQPDGKYYFMEMNTRLQVEHTITEMVTGIDLVKEQVRIFSGEKLSIHQKDVKFKDYAIQCRVLSENVMGSFIPSFGKITYWHMPGGPGVRIDSGYACNDVVSPYYDSLIAKICCVASDKSMAVLKMKACLEIACVEGIDTNIEFLKTIIKDPRFLEGRYDEKFTKTIIEQFI